MQSNKNKSEYQNFLTLKVLFCLLNLIEYNSKPSKIHCLNTLYAYFCLCFLVHFPSLFETFHSFFECEKRFFKSFLYPFLIFFVNNLECIHICL